MSTVEIVERPSQPTIHIHGSVGIMKIAKLLGNSYGALTEYMKSVNGQMVGAPFAQYTDLDIEAMTSGGFLAQIWQMLTSRMHIDAGFPVQEPLSSSGEVVASEIPAGRYVRTIHTGPYHKVGEAYRRMVTWAKAEGIKLGDRSIESYIDDPTEVASSEVRTAVFVPVAE